MRSTSIVVAVASVLLAACSANATSPSMRSTGHLFLGGDNTSTSTLSIYARPISSSSTAVGSLALAGTGYFDGICVDPTTNRLFAPDEINGVLAVFNSPVTNGAAPAFTLTFSNLGDCAFDANGNLYVPAGGNGVNVFPAPVTSTSTSTSVITMDLLIAERVTTDSSGDVFVANQSATPPQIIEFGPLGLGNPELAKFGANAGEPDGIAIGPDGFLYVADGTTLGKIDVYKPPFSNTSTVDHTLSVSALQLDRLSFGPDGNLYVSGYGDNLLYVIPPPYTGAPTVSLPHTTPTGIAFGP